MSIMTTIEPKRCHLRIGIFMFVGLFSLVLSACFGGNEEANKIPAACLLDSGDPAEPLQYPGAWAIVLNFNHEPSATHTQVCWAIRDETPEMEITYIDGLRCQVRKNVNDVMVGDGQADFDGHFHIACPRRDPEIETVRRYDTFYVHAEAMFPEADADYPLVRHRNLAVRTRFEGPDSDGNWETTVRSRFGDQVLEETNLISEFPNRRRNYNSFLFEGKASHLVDREIIGPGISLDTFEFDFAELMFIGGGENSWTLYEMVIDPPGHCGDCFN